MRCKLQMHYLHWWCGQNIMVLEAACWNAPLPTLLSAGAQATCIFLASCPGVQPRWPQLHCRGGHPGPAPLGETDFCLPARLVWLFHLTELTYFWWWITRQAWTAYFLPASTGLITGLLVLSGNTRAVAMGVPRFWLLWSQQDCPNAASRVCAWEHAHMLYCCFNFGAILVTYL